MERLREWVRLNEMFRSVTVFAWVLQQINEGVADYAKPVGTFG